MQPTAYPSQLGGPLYEACNARSGDRRDGDREGNAGASVSRIWPSDSRDLSLNLSRADASRYLACKGCTRPKGSTVLVAIECGVETEKEIERERERARARDTERARQGERARARERERAREGSATPASQQLTRRLQFQRSRETVHTTHYTLHTTHYTLHTTHYTLRTTRYTLHTALNTLYTTTQTLTLNPEL